MIILRTHNFSKKDNREVVDKETAELGKKEGVVQKKPSGKWGIISYKATPPRWWDSDYDTKEDAEDALKAYHANRH
jgi:hypothetical protein